jgi:hypothetical protein
MGLLQPHGRCGRRLRQAGLNPAERFIVIHTPGHAHAALAAAASLALPVTLASAPGAGLYAGPGWFKAVIAVARSEFPAVACACVLDCGDEPGMVLAALRHGLKRVRFDGPDAVAARLADIAAQRGAAIERGALEPALDLIDRDDPEALCRAFLAAERHALPDRFP